MLPRKTIHIRDAIRRIMDRHPHEISVWKTKTGEILHYSLAVYSGGSAREGQFRVRLSRSGEIRQFCEIHLRMVDGLRVML